MNSEVNERFREIAQFLLTSGAEKNQASLARKIGTKVQSLNMAITGYREPSLGLMVKLCETYGISFDWMLTGEGRMFRRDTIAQLRKTDELQETICQLRKRLQE